MMEKDFGSRQNDNYVVKCILLYCCDISSNVKPYNDLLKINCVVTLAFYKKKEKAIDDTDPSINYATLY